MLKHRTARQRAKDGESDIGININNITLLFLENGVKEFDGAFWSDYRNAIASMQEYTSKSPVLFNNETIPDDSNGEFQLSDRQSALLDKAYEFVRFARKYVSVIPNDDINTWNVDKLQSYILEYNMDVKPMPNNKTVLVKVVYQINLFKEKLHDMMTHMPEGDDAAKQGGKILAHSSKHKGDSNYRLRGTTGSDSEYSEDEMELRANIKIMIGPHSLLPDNLNLNQLPNWSNKKSVAQVFSTCFKQRFVDAAMSHVLDKSESKNGESNDDDEGNAKVDDSDDDGGDNIFANQINDLIAKFKHFDYRADFDPFDDMQQSFGSIAKHIDMCGLNNIDSISTSIVQDKQNTRGIMIIPCFVKNLKIETNDKNNEIPIICVKYYDEFRSRMTSYKASKIHSELMHGTSRGFGSQKIMATLNEIAMMGKLLKQNRKKLNQMVLKEIEKKHILQENIGLFKCSVFMPYCQKDKNLTKCANCGSNAVSCCSRCSKVSYCSQNCQRKHWKSNHESQCLKT